MTEPPTLTPADLRAGDLVKLANGSDPGPPSPASASGSSTSRPTAEHPRMFAAEVILNGTAYVGLIPWSGDTEELEHLARGAVHLAIARATEWT